MYCNNNMSYTSATWCHTKSSRLKLPFDFRQIFSQFNSTESKVDSILTQLPQLRNDCRNLAKVSEEINARKARNSQVLARTSQLLDVLELPQLMDSCIRRGQFEEALELFSYVRRLGNKHGTVPLIAVSSFLSVYVFSYRYHASIWANNMFLQAIWWCVSLFDHRTACGNTLFY